MSLPFIGRSFCLQLIARFRRSKVKVSPDVGQGEILHDVAEENDRVKAYFMKNEDDKHCVLAAQVCFDWRNLEMMEI